MTLTFDGLFSIVGFFIGLVALVLSFGIVNRTKDDVKTGFIFVFLSMVAFVVFDFLKILEIYLIISRTIATDVFFLVFVLFLVVGMWKLRTLIRGLSDFGQAFVLTSEDKYDNKLVSLVKDVKGVCYVTLQDPYKKVVDFFDLYNIDTSKIHFIDASGEKCDADNCIGIENNPDTIKNTIDRVLKEKDLSVVVIDNITGVRDIEKFELAKFVQDTASLIKSNEAQGFFIGNLENLDKETINDITMLVDKVIGDEKKW